MKYKYGFKILWAPICLLEANEMMHEIDFDMEALPEDYIKFMCDRDDLTTEIFRHVVQKVIEDNGGKLYHIEGGKIS